MSSKDKMLGKSQGTVAKTGCQCILKTLKCMYLHLLCLVLNMLHKGLKF